MISRLATSIKAQLAAGAQHRGRNIAIACVTVLIVIGAIGNVIDWATKSSRPSAGRAPNSASSSVLISTPTPSAASTVPPIISGSDSAEMGCTLFHAAVLPVIKREVVAGDLAPLIRLELGEPVAAAGPITLNAPYAQVVNSFNLAADDDARYQPLATALASLTSAIVEADPAASLQLVLADALTVDRQCAAR